MPMSWSEDYYQQKYLVKTMKEEPRKGFYSFSKIDRLIYHTEKVHEEGIQANAKQNPKAASSPKVEGANRGP